MTALPLNGRSYTDLMGLQAGVVPSQFNTGFIRYSDRPVSGTLFAGNVSVNGQRESSNSFLVNGGDVEESRNNGTSIIPVIDSIQEFRLITNSFDPEYGRFSGAVVNVVTKSGTNNFHGDAFGVFRPDVLAANEYFNKQSQLGGTPPTPNTPPSFHRYQAGGAFGGPIIHNKLFFFGDYEGLRVRKGVTFNNQAADPSGFKWRRIDGETGAGIGALAHADPGDIARHAKCLHGHAERVRMRRQQVISRAIIGSSERRLDQ